MADTLRKPFIVGVCTPYRVLGDCPIPCSEFNRVGSGSGDVWDTSALNAGGSEYKESPNIRRAESESLLEEYSRISQKRERSMRRLLLWAPDSGW